MIRDERRTAAGSVLCYASRAVYQEFIQEKRFRKPENKNARGTRFAADGTDRSIFLMFGSETEISRADADIF